MKPIFRPFCSFMVKSGQKWMLINIRPTMIFSSSYYLQIFNMHPKMQNNTPKTTGKLLNKLVHKRKIFNFPSNMVYYKTIMEYLSFSYYSKYPNWCENLLILSIYHGRHDIPTDIIVYVFSLAQKKPKLDLISFNLWFSPIYFL